MNVTTVKSVHLIGIGGVNMSAVAKLLLDYGVRVTGSDAVESEFTQDLRERGAIIFIGHDADHVDEQTEVIVYTSAVSDSSPGFVERAVGQRRGLPELTNFEFLGEWTKDKRVALVTGTHGKSTTTAMLGLSLIDADFDPTVIVGSRVKEFPEGNIRLGKSDLFVIEGDEYARHFLEFHPTAIIINNIELDHTDIFPDLKSMVDTFRELLRQVKDGGMIVANGDSETVRNLFADEMPALSKRGVKVFWFGQAQTLLDEDFRFQDVEVGDGEQVFGIRNKGQTHEITLSIPGSMNVYNATAAFGLALSLGADPAKVTDTLGRFHGIWRRFEKVAEKKDVIVISDYAHHPTAVMQTLSAAKAFYPDRRLVVCFQPHHRNRTKHLFLDFVPSFDLADILILSEIYDVKGREEATDQDISSRDLVDAVIRHDADRGARREVMFVSDPDHALKKVREQVRTGDLVLIMGAGDIYKIADQIL